jgi:hypothetical protein
VSAKLRADDRVLMLAIPSSGELAAIARLLAAGSLVALGTAEEVDSARASLAEFDNIMFLDARPDSIPWRDAYFTKILVPPHLEPLLRSAAPELHRLLAPGGEIITSRQDC